SVVSVILFSSILFLNVASASAATTIRFKILQDSLVVIPVYVNGAGPFDFLLDTGTTTSMVDTELAHVLLLTPKDRVMLTTVNGTASLSRAWLDRVAIGDTNTDKLEVVISELKEIHRIAPKIRGVIGQNFLKEQNFLLDYQHQRIDFEAAGEIEQQLKGTKIPIQNEAGKSLISARQGIRKGSRSDDSLRLVLDSGASNLTIFNIDRSNLNLDFRSFGAESLSSSATARSVDTAVLRWLEVGDQNLTRLPIVLTGVGEGYNNQMENGLMPTHLFRSIYFNNEKKYVIFNPTQGK